METYSIWSDFISRIEYDSIREDLYVYFTDETYGVYRQVPKNIVDMFATTDYPKNFYRSYLENKFHEIILPQTEK